MKTENRGGKRPNAGRKPATEKKEPITIYITDTVITANGGKDSVKQELTNYINNKPTNK